MDLNLNQAKRSRRKHKARGNYGALIIKIHRLHFKKTVLRLTGCPPNRHVDMFRPPPLVVDSRRPSTVRNTTLPYRLPAVPNMTTAVITSTVESLNAQPPSPPSLPSPQSLPPPLSPREQEAGEAWVAAILQDFENIMMENDTNQEQLSELWSPLPPLVANGDEYQQQESIPPPPVPVWPDSQNDQGSEYIPPPPVRASAPFGSLEWRMSSNNPWENIPSPPVPASEPFGSLNWPSSVNDLISEDIHPPLVPATSPYGSLYWQWPDFPNGLLSPSLPLPLIQPVPATSPLRSLDWPNSPNDWRWVNMSPPIMVTSPLESPDWPNPPNYQQPENVPPLVPATSPLRDLEWPYSPNNIPSPPFLSSPTFLPSPTAGLLPNLN